MQRSEHGGRRLVVMARWPAAGRCKSRLARGDGERGDSQSGSGIGSQRSAAVQQRLGEHALAAGREARRRRPLELVLAGSGIGARRLRRWGLEQECDRVLPQGHGSLGLRLQRQLLLAQRQRIQQLVLVGSDLPQLAAADLEAAFAGLEQRPLVLGPALDGGYWLIGLQLNLPLPWQQLFCGIPWGSATVLAATRRAALQLGLEPLQLAAQGDLDWPADLARWR
jgi:rSAM/selenodomain-associated transferase 1